MRAGDITLRLRQDPTKQWDMYSSLSLATNAVPLPPSQFDNPSVLAAQDLTALMQSSLPDAPLPLRVRRAYEVKP